MVKFVILNYEGDISEQEIALSSKEKQKQIDKLINSQKFKTALNTKFKQKGKGKLNLVSTIKYGDSNNIIYYAFLKGNNINNHEIPFEPETNKDKYKLYQESNKDKRKQYQESNKY